MRILVFPRNDQNPYQRLLYSELQRDGVQVSYLGRLTASHTLNILLLPLELATRRIMGGRLVHIHWLYPFGLSRDTRFPYLRRLTQVWLGVWLRTARLLGLRLVWTVHNVLPHFSIFPDDVAARRMLVSACDLVLAHSEAALTRLVALGAVPRRSVVIPHGPLLPARPAASLRIPGSGDGPRQFLFFGQVREYKGVEDLLAAFATLPACAPARLTIAGQCHDQRLRSRLDALARSCGERVVLHLAWIPDEELTLLLAAADVVVLPYRSITTSGSAMLALAHGRPLIVPDFPVLADLSPQATVTYDRTQQGLTSALSRLARAEERDLAAMSGAACAHASSVTWHEIATRTRYEIDRILNGAASRRSRPTS